MPIDLDASAHEHAAHLRAGDYTARALAEATLARIHAQEPALHAYITFTDTLALEQADAADARLRAGDAGPLVGVPVAVKDLLSTQGVQTTAASRMLAGFVPIVDCTVVQRLKAAVVCTPRVESRSFTATGTPVSGPASPARSRASAASACASARSSVKVM